MHRYFINIVLPAIQALMEGAQSSKQFFGNLQMKLDVSMTVTPDKETPSKVRLRVSDYFHLSDKTLDLEFSITEHGPGKLPKLRILSDDSSYNCSCFEVLAEIPLTGKRNSDRLEIMHKLHGILASLSREYEKEHDVDPEDFLK
tara:strand:+ start:114 stop:545 length:432 start_codon:yes stop_codon:yes gene_type:complete